VQLAKVALQVQPVPERPVIARPMGGVSAAVTVPLVGPVPVLLTVTVNVAPVWPRVKFPECVLVIFRAGVAGGFTVTVSLPVPGVEPPPEMRTILVTDDAAFVATETVTVMVG